jgi:hypothetical protein
MEMVTISPNAASLFKISESLKGDDVISSILMTGEAGELFSLSAIRVCECEFAIFGFWRVVVATREAGAKYLK